MNNFFHLDKLTKRSFAKRVVLLFAVCNLVSVLLFSFNMFSMDKANNQKKLELTLNDIVIERSQLISLTMQQIETETENVAKWTETYLTDDANYTLSDEYYYDQKGVLQRKAKKSLNEEGMLFDKSAVFFPATQKFDDKIKNFVMASEKMDDYFARIYKNIPYLTWVAIPMSNGFLRIYPYTEMDMYQADHMQSEDPFYNVATKNNPQHKTIWSEPYMDLMGSGWVLTCTHPIMDGNKVAGVACLDVNLETLKQDMLADFRLGETGFAFMISDSGKIIYHPETEPKLGKTGDVFQKNIIKDTNFSQSYKAAIGKVIEKDSGLVRYSDKGITHMIAYNNIEGTPWKLAIEVNQDEFSATGSVDLKNIILLTMTSLLMISLFAIFLYQNYTRPLKQFAGNAKRISQGDYCKDKSTYPYIELEDLSQALNRMSDNIQANTNRLLEKNQEIVSILNGIGGLLMTVDKNLRIQQINRHGIEEINLDPNDILGKKCYEVAAGQSEICRGCKILEALDTRREESARVTVGSRINEISYHPIFEENGEVSEVIVLCQDVTERVILERELLQREKLANIGQLSSSIAHEMKAPLSVIRGATYLIQSYNEKTWKDSKIKHQAEIIVETIKDSESIIYNLLDFSRLSKGDHDEVDIEKLVNQVIMISRQEIDRINVTIDTSFSTHPFLIHCSKEPLKQIIINLVSNAFSAIENGGHLTIRGEYLQKQERTYMLLAIRDDGEGIDSDVMKLLFKPFSSHRTSQKGIGLGLWVSSKLAERLGGEIKLQSEKGVGTEATLILPVTP